MAELAIGAVGLVGLVALFETCVSGFEYIELGHDFSKDYQLSSLEFRLVQLRLSRWGQAVDITDDYPIERQKLIRPVLASILNTLNDVQKISVKYAGDGVSDADSLRQDDNIGQICSKVEKLVVARQKKTPLMKKVKWALYQKHHFDELIRVTSGLVDNLVDLFPATKATQLQLCAQDLEQITQASNDEQLQLVQAASEKVDVPMSKVAETAIQGHRYQGNILNSLARGHYGDMIGQGASRTGASHVFETNVANDSARAHYGDRVGPVKDIFDD